MRTADTITAFPHRSSVPSPRVLRKNGIQLWCREEHSRPRFDRLWFVERNPGSREIANNAPVGYLADISRETGSLPHYPTAQNISTWERQHFRVFWDNYTFGNGSYTYSGDMNGDGVSGNDLIYVPRNQSEMNFVPETVGGVTFTAAAAGSRMGQVYQSGFLP